jgi:hypothetical protein
MRLDDGGQRGTIAKALEQFAGEPWLFEIEELLGEEDPVVVRFHSGLSVEEPVETGDGPYAFVVDGDLVTTDHVSIWTDDYRQGRVIITGDLRARSLSFGNGARVIVGGDAVVERACVGQYGDRNAVLEVSGTLTTGTLLLDPTTAAYAYGGVRALLYADEGFWEELRPDIVNGRIGEDGRFFRPEILDRYGDVDFAAAIAFVRAGEELLLPGVLESFPDRLTLRHT